MNNSTTVNQGTRCPNCDRQMPKGVLAGLCPACLLGQGAATEVDTSPKRHKFEPLSLSEVSALFPSLEIMALLGAGGMGAVYKARQPTLDRMVALKILPSEGVDRVHFAERFNREARALARLTHPNIVTVHEFGEVQGLHFFIMEFVDGANLRQLEKAGRLSPREALQIILQICDALQYAHDEGVVHRDIKPENVLVDRKGRVKIADFGLAKILSLNIEAARLTAEGQVMGTPHYMAPEQLERPLTVDHRADIFSLGVVLYEMLTGDLPLGKFSPPSRKVQVDVRFDEVVLRALENDPGRRYQQVSEVKTRVENIAENPFADPAPTEPAKEYLYWMGFPLVSDVTGRRKLNWSGVLPALAVVFGILTLVFAPVSFFTGRSLLGWIGIIGWKSVVGRACIAIAIMTLAFIRLWHRPIKAEVPRTANGTVVVGPRRTGWSRGRLALLSVAVMGCVFGFSDAQWLVQRAYDWWFIKSAAVQIAAKDPTSGSLRANLPFGGTVELIALSTPDSMEWWAPDGSVRPDRLIEMEGVGDASQAGLVSKDVAFRFTGFSAGPSDVKFDFRPSAAIWAGGELKIDGKEIDGAWPLRAAWPKSVRKATMRLGFGIPTWRTIGKQAGFTSTIFRSYGDPQWSFRFPTMPTEKGGGCHVSFIFGPENKHWNYRLVAVGQNDVEHLKSRAFATAVDQFTVWDYEFSETVENIKEFRIQVQAVHWVEFRDVALDGRGVIQHTLKPAQFGPVHDLEFADLIDFDSGKTGTFPENQTSASFGEGVGQNVAWMQKNGFDAEAGNKKLNTVGMSFVNLDNEDWNNFDPEVLRKRIQAEAYFPWELKPSNEAKLPATFGFRTGEGGLGMLQLVAFAENVPGATIRYKILQKRQIETP